MHTCPHTYNTHHAHTSQGIPAAGAEQRRLMQQQIMEGGEGGGEGGAEGGAGRPLNLQPMLDQLSQSLQTLINELRPPPREEESEEDSSNEDR